MVGLALALPNVVAAVLVAVSWAGLEIQVRAVEEPHLLAAISASTSTTQPGPGDSCPASAGWVRSLPEPQVEPGTVASALLRHQLALPWGECHMLLALESVEC
jgi:hypothetical protein